MADATVNDDTSANASAAKGHFAKAIEEAKAGAQALGKEAQERAGEYREKLNQKKDEWSSEARAKSGDAKDKASEYAAEGKAKAYDYATEGKAKASQAISGLGKLVEDNAGAIDEKVGEKYGDYARSAAKSIQDTATKLDEKSLEELGEDAKEFVREKPALAVGLAAAAGFMLARIFRGK